MSGSEVKVLERVPVGCAISNLCWDPSYKSLAVGNTEVIGVALYLKFKLCEKN